MSKTVDARGLACPQPVILAKKALKENSEVTVIVDNDTAQKNVTLAAGKQGAEVEAEKNENGTYLYLRKSESVSGPESEKMPEHHIPGSVTTAVVIPGETMGRGSDELGNILIRGFFHALTEQETLPDTVIFFNAGVKLVCKGSEVIEDIRKLSDAGVRVLACGTCLEYFGLKDDVIAGDISNMYTIVETLMESSKIIEL